MATAPKTAFVTGFTGQDGTFLTELLLGQGYRVIGLCRRVSTEPPIRTRGRFNFSEHLSTGQLILETGDLLSPDSLVRIIKKYQPEEVYNLAAQSDVHISFLQPEFTIDADLMGVVNLITALEAVGGDNWRMYQASTSEMYGDQRAAMDENTAFMPNSPYAVAKAAAHYYCQYKRRQGRYISCGILFNHESEIRGGNFVTQKVIEGVLRWHNDYQEPIENPRPLELGNLDSSRDWGYAGDYVKAMWLMLQQPKAADFVIGTGETHTVREFVELSAKAFKYKVDWIGEGKKTKGYINDKLFVVVSEKYWRSVDVRYLRGDATKARLTLGWQPDVKFEQLVKLMVDAAIERHHGR